jgi:hypothetical protein
MTHALVKMKISSFAGTLVMGQLVKREKNMVHLRNCCLIHNIITKDEIGNVTLAAIHQTSFIETEGVWEISEFEIVSFRLVENNEPLMSQYVANLENYRKDKTKV